MKMLKKLMMENEIGGGQTVSEGFGIGRLMFSFSESGIKGKHRCKTHGGSVMLTRCFNLSQLGYLGDHVAFLAESMEIPHHLKLALQYSNIPALKGVNFVRRPREMEEVIVDGYNGKIYSACGKNRKILDMLGMEKQCTSQKRACVVNGVMIKTNADTPSAVLGSFRHGADGIGLCRTGYLFFRENFKELLRRFLTGNDRKAGKKIYEIQKNDFKKLLNCVPERYPITVRLWDNSLGDYFEEEREENPVVGKRGVRLGFFYPELYGLQIEALLDAHYSLSRNARPVLEILIPFVSYVEEFKYWKTFINKRNKHVKIGCMIETPRSMGIISDLAKTADFLCFGTNDLTQTFIGMSRDGAERYYFERADVYGENPFEKLDSVLCSLICKSLAKAKKANPQILLGIVGAQASRIEDMRSLIKSGLDYISVNYRDIKSIRERCGKLDLSGGKR